MESIARPASYHSLECLSNIKLGNREDNQPYTWKKFPSWHKSSMSPRNHKLYLHRVPKQMHSPDQTSKVTSKVGSGEYICMSPNYTFPHPLVDNSYISRNMQEWSSFYAHFVYQMRRVTYSLFSLLIQVHRAFTLFTVFIKISSHSPKHLWSIDMKFLHFSQVSHTMPEQGCELHKFIDRP